MAGRARGELNAGIYHVTMRTAGPIPMFADDNDRTMYCILLRRLPSKAPVATRMFCLMTTHVHLLLETREDNTLQTAMKWLNWSYAWWFNRRHDRTGHFHGRRYWCMQIGSTGHLLNATRYIARNPVVAGLCERAEEWPWSSYRSCIGLDTSFDFADASSVQALFGDDRSSAIAGLRAFVSAD